MIGYTNPLICSPVRREIFLAVSMERDVAALRVELIQTAAVAIAWIEELDNGGALPRG